jgi:ABC-type nitrate/sulfonate/bicarbonate transport system substrate-binding protein
MLEAAASPAGASPATALTPVTYQLGWLANVENAGEFVADTRGYFADEGIKITLVPGGPTTTVEPLVLAGRCLVGLSETDTTAQAITQGGKLKTIGATLQVTPLAVASLASKPIDTPFDLYGKKFGVQAFQDQVVDAFFKTIGVDKSKITIVPASGDPSILPAGEVDALFVLLDNEPITLALQGVKTHTFTLDQYGWNVFGDTLEVADASLANAKTRDIIVHVVRAVVRGWQNALSNPSPAVSMVVNNYGRNLKLSSKQQLLELEALKSVIATPYTKAHGLLKMSPSDIEVNLKSIRSEGIKGVTESMLFDTTVIEDAFDGKTTIS